MLLTPKQKLTPEIIFCGKYQTPDGELIQLPYVQPHWLFSTADFACSSWGRSRHTGHVYIALTDTCRIITGSFFKGYPNNLLVCTGGDSPSPHTPKGCQQRRSLHPRRLPETHSMANALPSTGFHP